jgi:hypothetical protein
MSDWQPKTFYFSKQKKFGDKGELNFIKHYQDLNARAGDGFVIDILINDNDSVELKCDSYPMKKTENFFIERYGNIEKKKDGSVWRSSADKIKYFVYYYISDNAFFWFKVEKLKKYIDKNANLFQTREVRNPGYSSLGYLIPREKVKHLIEREDKF